MVHNFWVPYNFSNLRPTPIMSNSIFILYTGSPLKAHLTRLGQFVTQCYMTSFGHKFSPKLCTFGCYLECKKGVEGLFYVFCFFSLECMSEIRRTSGHTIRTTFSQIVQRQTTQEIQMEITCVVFLYSMSHTVLTPICGFSEI